MEVGEIGKKCLKTLEKARLDMSLPGFEVNEREPHHLAPTHTKVGGDGGASVSFVACNLSELV